MGLLLGAAGALFGVSLCRFGVVAGLLDRGVPLGLGGGDPGLGVAADLVGFGCVLACCLREGLLGLGGPCLGGREVLAHFLGGLVGLRAELPGLAGAPFGGCRAHVRIDRGKDFLSRTVAGVLAGFAVRVGPLPGYTPHLKGSVETVNGASERMFAAGLPRYTHAQLQASGRPVDPGAPALRFEAFVAELLAWVAWWNTENVMPTLKGRTPLQAWLEDPTPLTTVPAADLRLLMLEDDGRTRKITTKGVAWRARQYVAAWMTGQAGREVRLRYMPHHEHEVEVFDARTGEHLGAAFLADQASPERSRRCTAPVRSAAGACRLTCARRRKPAGSGTRP